jgi:hypothetical protein
MAQLQEGVCAPYYSITFRRPVLPFSFLPAAFALVLFTVSLGTESIQRMREIIADRLLPTI